MLLCLMFLLVLDLKDHILGLGLDLVTLVDLLVNNAGKQNRWKHFER